MAYVLIVIAIGLIIFRLCVAHGRWPHSESLMLQESVTLFDSDDHTERPEHTQAGPVKPSGAVGPGAGDADLLSASRRSMDEVPNRNRYAQNEAETRRIASMVGTRNNVLLALP